MIQLYPNSLTAKNISLSSLVKSVVASAFFLTVSAASFSQVLSFHSPKLISGNDGQDGAMYRFSNINDTLDAVVTINGRSTSNVTLVNLDDSTAGYYTAFQPVVTINNGTVNSATDWWMDFSIVYVKTGTMQQVAMKSFSASALDIDGNGSRVSEYVSFYYMQTYSLLANTRMTLSNLFEFVNGLFGLIGEKFVGPSTNYPGIDSANTGVMVNTLYSNISAFRVRTGAQSTRSSTGATRDYAFTFASLAAASSSLPVQLISWNATTNDKGVSLNWSTAKEMNACNYVIERSVDGVEYKDAAMVFTQGDGNSNSRLDYSYTDKISSASSGLLYYRLRMVDADGKFTRSAVCVVRVGKNAEMPVVKVYPNPAVNNVMVTVPTACQNKEVSVDIYNNN
ncbi:MAG: hypothetical protein JST39_05105, partial [Bacteroidetes bacterium]|nr:hypothetical protein [Bacteroidota bacterium]